MHVAEASGGWALTHVYYSRAYLAEHGTTDALHGWSIRVKARTESKLTGPHQGRVHRDVYYVRPDGLGELRYTTVHGAGHMVPQWRPQAALHMAARFLSARPF